MNIASFGDGKCRIVRR